MLSWRAISSANRAFGRLFAGGGDRRYFKAHFRFLACMNEDFAALFDRFAVAIYGHFQEIRVGLAGFKFRRHKDAAIRRRLHDSTSVEESFFGVALEDISRAAELFLRIHERTNRVDGWVSLELSPLLAHDTGRSVSRARELFERAGLQNLFIKIPGTREGLGVIEESIFAGIPVNVTLLFSREQYLAAADAYLRGIERRIAAGLNPEVASVASVFISRWDVAVAKRVSPQLRDRLGIAMGTRIYTAFTGLISSDRSRRLYNFGARPQRLLN